jgi:hypothetical protein
MLCSARWELQKPRTNVLVNSNVNAGRELSWAEEGLAISASLRDDVLIGRVEVPRAVYMRAHASAASQEGSPAGALGTVRRCKRGVWLS